MALRFIDPDATTTVEVDGVAFVVGFWPPREAERIGAGIKAVQRIEDKDSEEAREAGFDVHRRMVQYGVRSFAGQVDGAIESEKIHGREHPKVSDRTLHQFYLNNAIWPLGLACLKWNNLSEEEKKTSG